jgi:type II secretory pathway pseudopilin PulG
MNREAAFTFVELLISSLLLVTVTVALLASFQSGIGGYGNIEESSRLHQTARNILDRINLDLRNCRAYSNKDTFFHGDDHRLSFLTLLDKYQDDKTNRYLVSITYAKKETSVMRLVKIGTDIFKEDSKCESEEMGEPMVENIVFSYGSKQKQGDITFTDSWPIGTPQALPLVVKVTLTLKGKKSYLFERSIYVPTATMHE